MDEDRQRRVIDLFFAARGRQPGQRDRYLARACGESARLRREVESLLLEHDRQGTTPPTDATGSLPGAPIADNADRETDAPVGGKVGRYRILGLLGRGGMGAVYEAEDPQLRRRIALKVLPADFANNPNQLARFKREAVSIASLNHPSIVTIHSVEEAMPLGSRGPSTFSRWSWSRANRWIGSSRSRAWISRRFSIAGPN